MIVNGIEALRELNIKADSYINFNVNSRFKFRFIRDVLINFLFRIIFLNNDNDRLICLKELHNFENEIKFDNSLSSIPFKIINFFVLRNHISLTIFVMKIFKIYFKSDLIKKIWRKLYSLV